MEPASPSQEPLPERRLLDRCLAGEAKAWEEFVGRYHAILEGAVRFTFYRCVYKVPAADVDNVVQDLYARLYEDDFRRLRSFEGRSSLGGWLKALAVRHTLNVVRDEKLRGRFGGGSLDELPLKAESPPEAGSDPAEREELRRLEALVDQLPAVQRTALKLFYYDGLSYRRISQILDVPVATLGSIISRARERLRELMGR